MEQPTFIYIMDPLCGWCYGFGNVISKAQEEYKDKMQFIVKPGGMVTGASVQPVAATADFILGAYKRVEEYAGVTFGELYLNMLKEGTEISDSEPPCRAIYTFNQIKPEQSVNFAHALQKKLYVEGQSLNNDDTYISLAKEFGIDATQFLTDMNSEENKYGTAQEFQWVKGASITGFPCCVIQKGEQYFLVARGFQPYEQLKDVIEKVLVDDTHQ